MANCRPYLDEQIEIIRPRVILALGAPAAKSFMGERFSITDSAASWFDGPLGIPVIVTFHPAYILRQTGGAIDEVKRLVWDDLKAVRDGSRAAAPSSRRERGECDELFDAARRMVLLERRGPRRAGASG